jgi:hypothetical protein
LRFVDGTPKRKAYTARGVSFTAAAKLPSSSHPAVKKLRWKSADEDAYHAVFAAAMDGERHQLLGYRDREYDSEQPATTALLFQCFSDAKTGMGWGDDDQLYFYIPAKALAAGDFGKAFTYCGE